MLTDTVKSTLNRSANKTKTWEFRNFFKVPLLKTYNVLLFFLHKTQLTYCRNGTQKLYTSSKNKKKKTRSISGYVVNINLSPGTQIFITIVNGTIRGKHLIIAVNFNFTNNLTNKYHISYL